MIPISTVFGSSLILFGLIGSLRGWAKEIIVAFSVILALFVEHVLVTFMLPMVGIQFDTWPQPSQFYIRVALFVVLAIFGYASPTLSSKLGSKVARENLQDFLLGLFLGLINGFLIIGSIFSFLHVANYGVTAENPAGIWGIVAPAPESASAELINYLPPQLIADSSAMLYVAVAAAFVFVIIVFV
ncbi:MAG: CvpA family protein [Anaerolineae bacterium]